jgi:hypothetical protein
MDVEFLEHESLGRAIIQADSLQFRHVLSNPCFEFWFLLHFERLGSLMTGTAVIRRLKAHLPDYEKGTNHFDRLYPRTSDAVQYAKDLFSQQWQHQPDRRKCNPCTQVHELVERLHAIARAILPKDGIDAQ